MVKAAVCREFGAPLVVEEIEVSPPGPGEVRVTPDIRIVIVTPGAGGYGPPAERAPEAVERDERSGKFSAAYIQRHYGAVGSKG